MDKDIQYKYVKPVEELSDFVESFWMLTNQSNEEKETVGLPDGRVDLILSRSVTEPFSIVLIGIGTQQHLHGNILANSTIFAVSFTPLGIEYLFQNSIADIIDYARTLPKNFWDFEENDLDDFDKFYQKTKRKIHELLPVEIDERKRKLFKLIYASNGEMSVKELSEKVYWSSRQINRYFNQQFGLSLKAYCDILRFRASLNHIAQGKLFPELNFADQNHFIKEIKKYAGVTPKELSKNEKNKFILLSTLKK